MSKKNKIILSSVILFIIIIIICYCASYQFIFKKKQVIYIPKSLTTTLYSTKESKYYNDANLKHLSVTTSKPYSQKFYDDTEESKEKSKKILDYLNEFDIKEIHATKFLNSDNPINFHSFILYYENLFIYINFPNESVFEIRLSQKDDEGYIQSIDRTYLIKDGYIDNDKLESLLKD